LADILPYRRRPKVRRKSRSAFARWSYLPWQPLAILLLVAGTFVTIQFVNVSTHDLANEMERVAIRETVAVPQHSIPETDTAEPAVEVDRAVPDESYRRTEVRPAETANRSMPLCSGWPRFNCVIDGDTIWYRGEKIRIADINAPETHDPHCTYEADLGRRATGRLIELLNAGPFEIVPVGDRDEDVYGRKLRLVERNGHSLGQTLVDEGLAERWQGYRRNWCT
jgi:endonuclease YncB( thermonuclease family)